MKRFLSWTLLLLLCSAIASADTMGRLRGKVKTPDGKPIEKVTITIELQGEVAQKYSATTNAKGEYVHIGIRPGNYRITPSREGYEPVNYSHADVTIVASDKPVNAEFTMKPKEAQAAASGQAQQPAVNTDAQLGANLLSQGKTEEAIAALQKAVQTEPQNALSHYNLGIAYDRADKTAEAEKTLQEAIKLKPDFGEAYLALGNLQLADKQSEKAVEPLRKASELMPQSYTAFYNLGAANANLSKWAEAEAAFRKATELSPKEPIAHYQLGMALFGQSKNAEAKLELMKYLELSPNAADRAEVEELIKSM